CTGRTGTAPAPGRSSVVGWWRSCRCLRCGAEGEPGVRRHAGPGVADPGMVGVVADQPGAFGPGPCHDVEVVHVVAGYGRRGAVPAVRDEDDVTLAHLCQHVRLPVGARRGDPQVA